MEIKFNRAQQSFQIKLEERIATQNAGAELKFSQRQDNDTSWQLHKLETRGFKKSRIDADYFHIRPKIKI